MAVKVNPQGAKVMAQVKNMKGAFGSSCNESKTASDVSVFCMNSSNGASGSIYQSKDYLHTSYTINGKTQDYTAHKNGKSEYKEGSAYSL